jgi:hypothetical protein
MARDAHPATRSFVSRTPIRLQAAMVLATIAAFSAMLALNQVLFRALEFAPGINYVYLPAGMRLLCTLLFAEAGAVGLLVVSWAVNFLLFFPGQFERPLWGGVITSATPYLVYRLARWRFGLGASLARLTPARLLVLVVACSLVSPLLYHVYFAWTGQHELLRGFAAMFIGDLTGTLIVIYAIKALLSLAPRLPRTG